MLPLRPLAYSVATLPLAILVLALPAGAASIAVDADSSTYSIGETVLITLIADVEPGETAASAFVRLEMFGSLGQHFTIDLLNQTTTSGLPEPGGDVQATAQFVYPGGSFFGGIEASSFDFFGLSAGEVAIGANLQNIGIAPVSGLVTNGTAVQDSLGPGWQSGPLAFQIVPEPGTAALLGLGLGDLALARRRSHQARSSPAVARPAR